MSAFDVTGMSSAPKTMFQGVDPKKYGVENADLQKYFAAAQAHFKAAGSDPDAPPKEFRAAKGVDNDHKHTLTYTAEGHVIVHIKRKMENGKGLICTGTSKKAYFCLHYDGVQTLLRTDLTVHKNLEFIPKEIGIAKTLLDSGAQHTMEPGSHVTEYKSASEKHKDAPRIFMSLPYYDYGTLQNAADRVSFSEKLQLIHDASLGLAEMHKQGIVHRDLKTNNVFVRSEEIDGKTKLIAKIGDFGLARHEKDLVHEDFAQGASIARPPEVCYARSEKEQALKQTAKADVWALGVMIYRLFFMKDNYENVIEDLPYLDRETYKFYPTFVNHMKYRLQFDQEDIDNFFDYMGTKNNQEKELLSLMKQCLQYHPGHRISSEEAAKKLGEISSSPILDCAPNSQNYQSVNDFSSGWETYF